MNESGSLYRQNDTDAQSALDTSGHVVLIGEQPAGAVTSSEAVLAAHAVLARECGRQDKRRLFWLSLGDTTSILIVYASVFYLLPLAHTQSLGSLAAKLFAVGFGLSVTWGLMRVLARRGFGLPFRQLSGDALEAANELARSEDVRSIGPLLAIGATFDGPTNVAVGSAVKRLLLRVSSADAGLFSVAERRSLNDYLMLVVWLLRRTADGRAESSSTRSRMLQSQAHLQVNRALRAMRSDTDADRRVADYAIAVLVALSRIGDASAIRPVEELAQLDDAVAHGENAQRVLAGARECLPLLRERVALADRVESLVRPAATDDTALVRPATTSGEVDQARLLRPLDADGDE